MSVIHGCPLIIHGSRWTFLGDPWTIQKIHRLSGGSSMHPHGIATMIGRNPEGKGAMGSKFKLVSWGGKEEHVTVGGGASTGLAPRRICLYPCVHLISKLFCYASLLLGGTPRMAVFLQGPEGSRQHSPIS